MYTIRFLPRGTAWVNWLCWPHYQKIYVKLKTVYSQEQAQLVSQENQQGSLHFPLLGTKTKEEMQIYWIYKLQHRVHTSELPHSYSKELKEKIEIKTWATNAMLLESTAQVNHLKLNDFLFIERKIPRNFPYDWIVKLQACVVI